MNGRRGKRRKQLLDDLKKERKKKKGYKKFEEEALDSTLWTARFGRGYGPVEKQATEW